jgi:hypothetical protein
MQTQLDLLKAVAERKPFLCHAPKDGKLCAGYVGVCAYETATPFPQSLQDQLAKWEYSPPDEEPPR